MTENHIDAHNNWNGSFALRNRRRNYVYQRKRRHWRGTKHHRMRAMSNIVLESLVLYNGDKLSGRINFVRLISVTITVNMKRKCTYNCNIKSNGRIQSQMFSAFNTTEIKNTYGWCVRCINVQHMCRSDTRELIYIYIIYNISTCTLCKTQKPIYKHETGTYRMMWSLYVAEPLTFL